MPKKILLADDSITIQKVVELTFSDGDYEVSAVNNGAKAIQKLAEMRPDIILSDIIMPEKNGYEVCEYVKSHPEYRNIPVVLLTGTFEPFDPDRAEKAGCDAVVTKPFESQSLIHKVEELIAQARNAINATNAVPAAVIPEPQAPVSPWMEETSPAAPPPSESSPFTTSGGSFPLPPVDSYTHNADIFAAPATPDATTEIPFEPPAAQPASTFAPSPWDEPASSAPSPFAAEPAAESPYSAETRAFTKMSFDDLQQMAAPSPAAEPEPESDSPFGAPPDAEQFSGETRAFPKMSFEEMQQMVAPQSAPPEPEPEPAIEPSPWDEPASEPAAAAAPSPFSYDEPEPPAFGGAETRAFPPMSFDAPAPAAEASPWDDQAAPAFGGETRAFPKMSFEEMQQMAAPLPESESEPEREPEPVEENGWAPAEDSFASESFASDSYASDSFAADAPAAELMPEPLPEAISSAAMPEDLPFASETTPEPEADDSMWSAGGETPALAAAEALAEPEEPVVPPAALAPEAPPMPIAARGGELTDDQVDRIARRVVELMSDHVIRNIAWEVIPDLAEMAVKERIRQLEAEA
jgi:CheY-like chemotaxis protein